MAQDACGIGGDTMSTDYTHPDWICIHNVVHHQCVFCRHPEMDKPREGPTMTTLEQIKRDIATLVEGRADDERFRKLVLEQLSGPTATNPLGMSLDERLSGLAAQIKGLGDGLADEIRMVRDSVVCAIGHAFVNFERKVSGAKAPRRSTKRKPRGRGK
jgi:hypothetical protein